MIFICGYNCFKLLKIKVIMGNILSFLFQKVKIDQSVELNSGGSPGTEFEEEIPEIDTECYRMFTKGKPKRALLVGINYDQDADESNDLRGCENDLLRISKVLMGKYHFKSEEVYILNSKTATKENIESSLLNMVVYAQRNPESELFFHFSGHGTQQTSFLERDGKSEALCPLDYGINGLISDRWLKKYFVNHLPDSCRLFCLVDCCHSGTSMNLCYNYNFDKESIECDSDYGRAKAKVIKISGCLDNQVSYDCYNSSLKIFNGALTDAFIINSRKEDNVVELVKKIRKHLKQNDFPQIPNLTMSGNLAKMKLY